MPNLGDFDYRNRQLGQVMMNHPDGMVLKIKDPRTMGAETKWLNITPEEFNSIRDILTNG